MIKLTSVLRNLASVPLYMAARIVPKQKSSWIFGAWFGARYGDNPAALLEYVLAHRPEISGVWITRQRSLIPVLRERGIPCLYAYSLRGIWTQMRAGAAFFSHSSSVDFFSAAIAPPTFRVNLWHGTPIKRIGLDAGENKRAPKWLEAVMPFLTETQDAFIAASRKAAEIYVSAFALSRADVHVLGDPRTDKLIREARNQLELPRTIIYLPTFRGRPGDDFDFFGNETEFTLLDEALTQEGITLFLRPHPVNQPERETREIIARCNSISFDESPDLHDQLVNFGALITDFSSIMFDFAILGRPIFFLAPDRAEYLQRDRDLYVHYREFTRGHVIASWTDLAARLPGLAKRIDEKRLSTPPTVKAYADARADGQSSERVYQFVVAQLGLDEK